MHQTLFYIPYEICGFPLFGFGILCVLWGIGTLLGAVLYWRLSAEKKFSELAGTVALSLFAGFVVCWVLPRAGRGGGIPVQAYGTMMLLGIVSAVALAVWRAPKFGFRGDQVFEICFWLCIPGILGARLFYVIEYWNDFQAPTLLETLFRIVNIPGGGLVVYGSIIGGILGGIVYLATHHLSISRMFDLLAPSLMLGLALGRIGCFLNGCCFGGVCDPAHVHWGVHFPAGSPPYMRQIEEHELAISPDDAFYGMRFASDLTQTAPAPTFISEVIPGGFAEKQGLEVGDYILRINREDFPDRQRLILVLVEDSRQEGRIVLQISRNDGTFIKEWVTTAPAGPVSYAVYPTQLYSSGNAFAICIFLLLYSRWHRNPNGPGMRCSGEVSALFLTLYPLSRFVLEVIRTDESSAFGTGLSISQIVSILLFLLALCLWAFLLIQSKRLKRS